MREARVAARRRLTPCPARSRQRRLDSGILHLAFTSLGSLSTRGLALLFERHTEQHHRFFTDEAMSYEGRRDYKMVLFPPVRQVKPANIAGTAIASAFRLCALRRRPERQVVGLWCVPLQVSAVATFSLDNPWRAGVNAW